MGNLLVKIISSTTTYARPNRKNNASEADKVCRQYNYEVFVLVTSSEDGCDCHMSAMPACYNQLRQAIETNLLPHAKSGELA